MAGFGRQVHVAHAGIGSVARRHSRRLVDTAGARDVSTPGRPLTCVHAAVSEVARGCVQGRVVGDAASVDGTHTQTEADVRAADTDR